MNAELRTRLLKAGFLGNPDDPRHGTVNGYSNLLCRCSRCREAWTEFCNELRQKRVARGVPDDIHGTANGYTNYLCRCAPCRDAYNLYRRRPGRRKRDEEVSAMYKDHLSGMTIEQIAEKFGVTVGTVYSRFRTRGLKLRPRNPVSLLYFDYCTGMSAEDVAAKHGLTVQRVYKKFREAGYALRPRPRRERKAYKRRAVNPDSYMQTFPKFNSERSRTAVEEHAAVWEAAFFATSNERMRRAISLRLDHPEWCLTQIAEAMGATKDQVAGLLRRAREIGSERAVA